jgi:hypothetical protein
MSIPNGVQTHAPDQLLEQLVKGYDALSLEIRLLDEQRRELENKVSWSKQQVRSPCPFFLAQHFHYDEQK